MRKIVYLISPKKIYKNFYNDLQKVLKSNKVKFFQLRLKNISRKKVVFFGKKIKKITDDFRVKLIINDDPTAAYLIKGSGCHIGQSDASFIIAKKILKKETIGVTCHGSMRLARKAIKNKADYIAIGSFFNSKLKPKAKKAKQKIIRKLKKETKIPIVAIGGINDKNYKKLISMGANYIAISSFIWNNPFLKPEKAINKFK